MANDFLNIVVCNNALIPDNIKRKRNKNLLILDCDFDSPTYNVEIKLQKFILSVYHLSDRIKDLLEIAGYIYNADRKISRGSKNAVEFQKWSRKIKFIIKVRDIDFWNQEKIKNKLKEALEFMSGDRSYDFIFQGGIIKDQIGLFDTEEFKMPKKDPTSVVLFSGGLDSLAGTLERLTTTNEKICLVSHISNQPSIQKTQNTIVKYLNNRFSNRCIQHKFYCHLKGDQAIEETQRTRSFLFCSIAYAISSAYTLNNFYCYENGITSINLKNRQDLINSRASKTTHPKTLGLLQELYSEIGGKKFEIKQPFFNNTKADILKKIIDYNGNDIISSSVSCSVSRNTEHGYTHCGICSQCIERRIAIFSNRLEKYDNGIYNFDFIKDKIGDSERDLIFKSSIIDYIRLACKLSKHSLASFNAEYLGVFHDVEEYISGKDPLEKMDNLYNLCIKHSAQIEKAIINIRDLYDSPFTENNAKSFLNIISSKEYFKKPVELFIETFTVGLQKAIPIAFNTDKPKNENVFNDYINSFLEKEKNNYEREFPTVKFSTSKLVPDHSFNGENLFIESKYLRGSTTQSKITDALGADAFKSPSNIHILFIIYDPYRAINNDDLFKEDFEKKGNCTIKIIR